MFINILFVNSQYELNKGLIAYYMFNKTDLKDSTIIIDETTNNNGKLIGVTSYTNDRFNNPCGALFFNGNTYINVPNSRSLQKPVREITIAAWLNISRNSDFYNQWITVCCKSNSTEESNSSPQYRMQATAQTISLNTAFTRNAIPQLDYDTWYFYVYTFDGNKVKGYLDGQIFYEESYQDKLKVNKLPLEIGRDLPGKIEYFYGKMDDLRIYERALKENEIYELFHYNADSTNTDHCQKNTNTNTNTNRSKVPERNITQRTLISKIDTTPIQFQKVISVENTNITIYPYDNIIDDGDIISINVNGLWVKENYLIQAKVKNPTNSQILSLKLNRGQDNLIVAKAINEGKIPLNTLTFLIDDGVSKQEVKLNSRIGLSGGIKITCK